MADRYIFIAAAKNGNIDELQRQLNAGININIEVSDNTALLYAIASRQTDAALFLLNKGADFLEPRGMGRTPFMQACSEGLLDVAKAILAKIPPAQKKDYIHLTDANGETAEAIAIRKKQLADASDKTAEGIAIRKKYADIVELFNDPLFGGRRKRTRRHKKRARKTRRSRK